MIKLNDKQQNIIRIIIEKGALQSSDVHSALVSDGEEIALVSVKRILSELVNVGCLILSGAGRNTSYDISVIGRLFANIDEKKYTQVDPDSRFGLSQYNFELWSSFPDEIFSVDELKILKDVTNIYRKKTADISDVLADKNLQRLIIELSWKSSKIEGNTYSLIDTERLIVDNKEAVGHAKDESRMILNHKKAFLFVKDNKKEFRDMTVKNLEKLHSILVKDLGVGTGLRKGLIGITGSKYRPLDNVFQIREAVDNLSKAIIKAKTPYDKALLALVGISYIQAFEDGNKRTGRLMANAILLAHDCAPLSYRSVDEDDYRGAILVFYETNSIVAIKNIFKDQYIFAANNYTVK